MNQQNNKNNKGITLIALIITILILIILSVVAINSIKDNNLINQAQNAVSKYQEASTNEEAIMQNYSDFIDEQIKDLDAE